MSTEAKTVTLSIGERLAAIRIFDAFKGSMATMKALLDDVKQLPVSEAEWTEANLTKSPTDEAVAGMSEEEKEKAQQTWKWDETVKKEVTFQGDVVEYLKAEIKKKSDAGEITISDAALVSLNDKIV